MGHSTNSPSAFHRRKLCPGSRRMEEHLPDTDNKYSLRGSAAHKVAEMCLRENKTPGYWLNQTIRVPKADGTVHEQVFDTDDNDAVWAYINYIEVRRDQMTDPEVLVERKVDPGPWLGRDDVAGSADCILIDHRGPDGAINAIEVVDYKHGSGMAVEAKDNTQTIQYILGALVETNWNDTPHDIPVTGTIVQPRCPHPDGPIRSWTKPATYFFGLVEEHKRVAVATDDPEAPLVPGDDQCFFCKAKGTCTAVAQAAIGAFSPVTEPDPLHGHAQAMKADSSPWAQVEASLGQPVDKLSMEARVALVDKAPMITAWLQKISESLLQDAVMGTDIPGHKVVRAQTHRKWGFAESTIIEKLSRLRTRENKALGKAKAIVTKALSVAQAEKQIKPLVTERSWAAVEKAIIHPEGSPLLVPLTDPRPAISKGTDAFQPVTENSPFG